MIRVDWARVHADLSCHGSLATCDAGLQRKFAPPKDDYCDKDSHDRQPCAISHASRIISEHNLLMTGPHRNRSCKAICPHNGDGETIGGGSPSRIISVGEYRPAIARRIDVNVDAAVGVLFDTCRHEAPAFSMG